VRNAITRSDWLSSVDCSDREVISEARPGDDCIASCALRQTTITSAETRDCRCPDVRQTHTCIAYTIVGISEPVYALHTSAVYAMAFCLSVSLTSLAS